MLYWIQRIRNGLSKVAAGLRPFGESVWPGVRNDLFVAHESIYHFFAGFARGHRVLDAGCGAGYGCRLLVEAGASSVLGIDIDRRSIRYAERHYHHPAITFQVGDCDALSLPRHSIDLVVASNMLEHLNHPERFIAAVAEGLAPAGRALIAVPPILSDYDRAQHGGIHYHRSNLAVDEWLQLLDGGDSRVNIIAHRYSGKSGSLDFASPFTSKARLEEFSFARASRDEVYEQPPITVIFSLEKF